MPETEDDDDLRSEDMLLDSEPVTESQPSQSQAGQTGTRKSTGGVNGAVAPGEEETEKKKECLLLSQASILRLLAELINSYPACALIVIESTRKIRIGQQTAKVCVCVCLFVCLCVCACVCASKERSSCEEKVDRID